MAGLSQRNKSDNGARMGHAHLLLLLVVFHVLCCEMSFAMSSKRGENGKSLYIYSSIELLRFFRKIGREDFWKNCCVTLSRNSNGTALRFVNDSEDKAVIVTCDGRVESRDLPDSPAWLNDDNEIVAWHKGERGLVYYQNGTSEKISIAFGPHNGPDPSGSFFMKHPLDSNFTEIFSIDQPEAPLAKVVNASGEKIFVKEDKVYLFASNIKHNVQTELYVFEKKEKTLSLEETVAIKRPKQSPAPFNVRDFSPWGNEVLFSDVHDFPSRSVFYVFNLENKEMKKIGKEPFSGGWGFYLQCDVINEVLQKQQQRDR
jgi:hypothetical protein